MKIIPKVFIKFKYYDVTFLEYSFRRNFKNIKNIATNKQNISLKNTKVNANIKYTDRTVKMLLN